MRIGRGRDALDELSDGEIARLADAGDREAAEEIFALYGPGLFQFCDALDPDRAEVLYRATVKRAIAELRAGDKTDPADEWLLRLAHTEAGEEGDAPADVAPPPAARKRPSLLARFRSRPRKEREVAFLTVVQSYGYDVVGGLVGLQGDSVEQLLQGARKGVMAAVAKSGPECEVIRQALALDTIPPLAQAAVDRHLEDCARCRTAQHDLHELGPALKRALPRISIAAMAFALREGLAHAAVGGSGGGSGGSSAGQGAERRAADEAKRRAAAEAKRVYYRRRSIAAGGVLGLLVVVAVLALSSGRLNDQLSSGSPGFPTLAFTFLSARDLVVPTPPEPDCKRGKPGCSAPVCPQGCVPPPVCPTGSSGTRPHCVPPSACPPGWSGTPPHCAPPPACPPGWSGTPPHCVPPPACPAGTVGTPPDCKCPAGTTGSPPHCVKPPPCPSPRVGSGCVCPDRTVEPDCHEPPPIVIPCRKGEVRRDGRCVPNLVPIQDLCDPDDRHHGHNRGHRDHLRPPERNDSPEPPPAPAPAPVPPPRNAPQPPRHQGHDGDRHPPPRDQHPSEGEPGGRPHPSDDNPPAAEPPAAEPPAPAPVPDDEGDRGDQGEHGHRHGPPHHDHGSGQPQWAVDPQRRRRERKRWALRP